VAELRQSITEKAAELDQKKSDLAKKKVAAAALAAEVALRRLGLTARKMEIERKALTTTDMLSHYELAKAEAVRAALAVQTARANAELARRELEAFKREAELTQLKAQAEKG
jgi:hypothetical protein